MSSEIYIHLMCRYVCLFSIGKVSKFPTYPENLNKHSYQKLEINFILYKLENFKSNCILSIAVRIFDDSILW